MRASGPRRWRQDGGLHWTAAASVCYEHNTRRRFSMRNWTMAILPLALVTACNGTAPKDEQQAERGGPPASVGPITTQSFDLTGFTGVEVAGPDDVTVRRGDSFSIVARGRQEVLDRLEIKVDGSQLSIGRKRDGFSFSSRDDDDLDIAITMPRLDKVRLTGSGSIDADSVDGDAIEAAGTGSGDIKIAKLTGQDAESEGSGTGAKLGRASGGARG